jgi:hypothetical protein
VVSSLQPVILVVELKRTYINYHFIFSGFAKLYLCSNVVKLLRRGAGVKHHIGFLSDLPGDKGITASLM